ncbi:MAG: toll/interleukin-1 receptor domain-containing protein [Betaproteobacteria bacterium]|nr:toll/interleukin-1 receptor domain-containing protein [Betaproteobacteria bacterium]
MTEGNEVIFISYRRAESSATAEYLTQQLDDRFGAGSTFRDAQGLGGGQVFPLELQHALERSLAMLVLVGRNWSAEINLRSQQAGVTDYVADELRRAHKLGIPIIPVLVEDEKMPVESDLPKDLQFFSLLHALPLRQEKREEHLQAIVAAVSAQSGIPDRSSKGWIAGLTRLSGQVITSPAELLFRPRRFLLRYSCGGWRDLLRLTVYLSAAFSLALLLYGGSMGYPVAPMFAASLPFIPAFLVLLLLPGLVLTALGVVYTRLTSRVTEFQRMFLVVAYIRGTLITASMASFALWLYWLGSEDHSLVMWRAEVLRAESVEDMFARVSEISSYAGESARNLAVTYMTAVFVLLSVWSYFAWNTLRATHRSGRILPLSFLAFTMLIECLLPILVVLNP